MLLLLNCILDIICQNINDFIQFCCDKWVKEFNVKIKIFFGVNVDWMRLVGYDEIFKYLNIELGKVVVFSIYVLMGVGKNFDYVVNLVLEGESLIFVVDVIYSMQL